MSDALSSSLGRVLAAPWQQRRNATGVWSLVVVLGLCSVFPLGLFAWSLLCEPGQVGAIRHGARVSGWVGGGALVVCGWAMMVGNVLQQNHPVLARLVPGHVERLRAALLAAWIVLVLAAAAGPGLALDAPLAWACCTAAALPLFTIALRWPLLWLVGFVAPYLMAQLMAWNRRDVFLEALQARWHHDAWAILGVVAAVGAMLLAAVIQSGGPRHMASFEWRRKLSQRFQADGGVACDGSPTGLRRLQAVNALAYAGWMRHLLARTDSPVMARVLLGLGPSLHWTTRLVAICWTLAAGAAAFAVAAALSDDGVRGATIAWAAPAALLALGSLGLQTHSLLHRTRREQALLALLPGVPRAGALNRWLAWQMSLQFLLPVVIALALSRSLFGLAEAMQPGVVHWEMGSTIEVLSVALLALLPWQWRRWARLRAPSHLDSFVPLIAALGFAVLALLLSAATGTGFLAVGVTFGLASLLWCAWRWWRMGTEPSAFPVGRLA